MGDLEEIFEVDMNNYEAVDVRSLMVDKDSGQARKTSGSISTPTPTPIITVTSPNGGESWKRGTTHTISWDYAGTPGSTVKIELLKGDALYKVLTPGTSIGRSNHGSYSWKLSATTALGTNYKIRVTSISNSVNRDTSNANFIIN
jgi:hypothetical protein